VRLAETIAASIRADRDRACALQHYADIALARMLMIATG
jgi:hypothetical protein